MLLMAKSRNSSRGSPSKEPVLREAMSLASRRRTMEPAKSLENVWSEGFEVVRRQVEGLEPAKSLEQCLGRGIQVS